MLIAAVAAAAVWLTHRPQHARAPHPLRGTVFMLRPGQCFDFARGTAAAVRAAPCAKPHDAEVFGKLTVPGRRWPGTAELGQQARSGCRAALGGYLNPQLATGDLTEFYISPNQGAWAVGARSVICEIRGTHVQLTSSVRALGS